MELQRMLTKCSSTGTILDITTCRPSKRDALGPVNGKGGMKACSDPSSRLKGALHQKEDEFGNQKEDEDGLSTT